MNFMSGRAGFYEEITGSRGGGNNNNNNNSRPSAAAAAFPLYSHESHGGAPPPDSSSPTTNTGEAGDDSDDHMFFRRGGGGDGGGSSGGGGAAVIQREHMFDKVVTPSDVGKLNRLVIPKQHAEKYFPLDSSTNEKGLLLNFEDRNGKPWRFRYSYWNSSQSYVMTKGWSRFVKEKKLDAGDIVSFQRGAGDLAKDRLFIDWRRRPDAPDLLLPPGGPHHYSFHRSSLNPWNNHNTPTATTTPLYLHPPPSRDYSHFLQPNSAAAVTVHHQYHHHHHPPTGYGPYAYNNVVNGNPCPPGSVMYLRSAPGGSSAAGAGGGGGGFYTPHHHHHHQQQQQHHHPGVGPGGAASSQRGPDQEMVFDSVPVVQGKAAAKRLRLFGVNMDCPISDSDHDSYDILSSTTLPLHHHYLPPPPPTMASFDSSSSSSIPSLQFLRPNNYTEDNKGKGSLDLDI
ncbi:hypothetical protein ABFS82_05G060600 [Erythranthe guttata]